MPARIPRELDYTPAPPLCQHWSPLGHLLMEIKSGLHALWLSVLYCEIRQKNKKIKKIWGLFDNMNISVFLLEMIWRPLICVNNLLNNEALPFLKASIQGFDVLRSHFVIIVFVLAWWWWDSGWMDKCTWIWACWARAAYAFTKL
jgi:hypothetical protein